MAGESDRSLLTLAITGTPRKLQVALKHLRNSVHSPISERPAAGEHRQAVRAVAVDSTTLNKTVGLPHRAKAQRFEPKVNEGGKSVIDLGEDDVGWPNAAAVPQTPGRLSSDSHDVVEWPVQWQP